MKPLDDELPSDGARVVKMEDDYRAAHPRPGRYWYAIRTPSGRSTAFFACVRAAIRAYRDDYLLP